MGSATGTSRALTKRSPARTAWKRARVPPQPATRTSSTRSDRGRRGSRADLRAARRAGLLAAGGDGRPQLPERRRCRLAVLLQCGVSPGELLVGHRLLQALDDAAALPLAGVGLHGAFPHERVDRLLRIAVLVATAPAARREACDGEGNSDVAATQAGARSARSRRTARSPRG